MQILPRGGHYHKLSLTPRLPSYVRHLLKSNARMFFSCEVHDSLCFIFKLCTTIPSSLSIYRLLYFCQSLSLSLPSIFSNLTLPALPSFLLVMCYFFSTSIGLGGFLLLFLFIFRLYSFISSILVPLTISVQFCHISACLFISSNPAPCVALLGIYIIILGRPFFFLFLRLLIS